MEKVVGGGSGVGKHKERLRKSNQLNQTKDTIPQPSPYYWGDYRLSGRSIRDHVSRGKGSSMLLTKGCFSTPNLVPNMPNPKSPGKEISKKLEVLNIRVGCVFLHTLIAAKRYFQLNPTKGYDGHMSTIEECRLKVMRAKGLLVSAEIGRKCEELAGPKNPNQGQEMDIQFMWAEKWCPKRLSDFSCNKKQALDLQFQVSLGHCIHMVFEGPPGVGKSSLIRAMIGEMFHSNDNQMRNGKVTIHLQENLLTMMVVPIKASSNHIELNLNGLRGYEINVVDLLLKEHNSKIINNSSERGIDCKVMVLDNADILTSDAQHYIRWLMERYQDSCKLIFCCSNVNKLQIIAPLCKVVIVENPSIEQIVQVLEDIADKEGSSLPRPFIRRIAENSDKCLPQAIRSLEATIRSQHPSTENQKIMMGWEDHIARIAKCVVENQTAEQLYDIHVKLQMLSRYYVSPRFVYMTLVDELKQHLDDNSKRILENLHVTYSCHFPSDGESLTQNQREGGPAEDIKRKDNLYSMIEEFAAKFMSLYRAADIQKNFVTENENVS